ncbi:hypothetical protein GCM10010495_11620 [Kitasatospora herbaricolor]|uniref:NADH-quinone oxidoreductase subunit C n=1 Tax=Kitasatospora herbaricolor TaxID=68217 RepID=UPI00174E6A4A|nr:NADH-quinone oxidoreductase subunit C [Kitasatospora herbaricolor]MDQ0308974.1 NADH-quinone oxidoreductase subunit C [Kitasatospora herbaricolor]GGV02253.1 hypothetical protein GCM10010495_11620 [Kitasatospora herbaricolor]
MSFDRTPEELAASIGAWATAAEAYELITVDVPAEHWIEALTAARDTLGLRYFDWLSAVDELAEGFSVAAHLAALDDTGVRHLLVRTRVPRERAALPTAVGVYAGAGWHERETHEMFGIDFSGHPHLVTLLLPDGFEGHPLRKEFVLAARVAKAWPGAKEPGESEGDGPARRKMQPAGVPDPNEWGPLKGTLPPVAERPARGARAAGAAGRPPRAAAGGAAAGAAGAAAEGGPAIRADRPRRTRSITEGSASQAAAGPAATPATPAGTPAGTPAEKPAAATPPAPARTQSSDAPWHAPVPAHGPAEPAATPAPGPVKPAEPGPEAEPESESAESEPARPTAAESEPAAPRPEAGKPEAGKPEAGKPEAGTPDAPAAGPEKPTQEGDSA